MKLRLQAASTHKYTLSLCGRLFCVLVRSPVPSTGFHSFALRHRHLLARSRSCLFWFVVFIILLFLLCIMYDYYYHHSAYKNAGKHLAASLPKRILERNRRMHTRTYWGSIRHALVDINFLLKYISKSANARARSRETAQTMLE